MWVNLELGIPRASCATVEFGRATESGSGPGGYVGRPVTMADLAGRMHRDLVLGSDTALTRPAWVGCHATRWESKPQRWFDVSAQDVGYRAADQATTRLIARAANAVAGR